jgi:hypothetical protein
MSYAKRRRQKKAVAVPVLAVAGLSLTLASGVSAAATGPAPDTVTRAAAVSHEITLREEEICDVSLATFHVFDKEGTGPLRRGVRLASCGCGACAAGWTGTYYTSSVGSDPYPLPPSRPNRPAHKHVRNKR